MANPFAVLPRIGSVVWFKHDFGLGPPEHPAVITAAENGLVNLVVCTSQGIDRVYSGEVVLTQEEVTLGGLTKITKVKTGVYFTEQPWNASLFSLRNGKVVMGVLPEKTLLRLIRARARIC